MLGYSKPKNFKKKKQKVLQQLVTNMYICI